MKKFAEYFLNESSEDVWTLLVRSTATDLYKFQNENDLEFDVYPLMKECYVVCDSNALQRIRDNFNIISEHHGDFVPEKKHYEFSVKMKKDYLHPYRSKRLETFFRDFKHYGLYSVHLQRTDSSEDHVMSYNLTMSAYDTRENVLGYLRSALKKGFEREDLTLENTNK